MNSILLVSASRIIEFIHNGAHTGRVLNSVHKCLTTVCVVIMPRADCTFKFHQWVPVVIIQQNRFSRPAYNTKVCVPSACCNNAKSGLHIWILPVSDSGHHTERQFQAYNTKVHKRRNTHFIEFKVWMDLSLGSSPVSQFLSLNFIPVDNQYVQSPLGMIATHTVLHTFWL